jgi:hypothetical protein
MASVTMEGTPVATGQTACNAQPKVYTFSQHNGALCGRGGAIQVLQDVLSRNHTAR